MQSFSPTPPKLPNEKHIPVWKKDGSRSSWKSAAWPIPWLTTITSRWICLQTKRGNQRKFLKPGDEPKACFAICDGDEVEAAYAFCNKHGLWKATRPL